MSKSFLLGVGCQKGGTTWVYEYLLAHPQADPGARKGHHIFDALFIPDMQPAFHKRIAKLVAYLAGEGPPTDQATLRSASYLFDINGYFDHFHYRLLRDPQIRLTADLTPDYAGLPVEALAMIRDGFAKRGVPIKVLFILRDPVDRCWSHAKMLRKQAIDAGETPPYASVEAHVRAEFATELFALRTRYDLTQQRLAQVFTPDQVLVLLYEHMFNEPTLIRLCDFLGIDALQTDLSRRVHASPEAPPLSEETIAAVAEHYAPVYEDAMRRFGPKVIEASWASLAHCGALHV